MVLELKVQFFLPGIWHIKKRDELIFFAVRVISRIYLFVNHYNIILMQSVNDIM
jgi:hypothetical protein